MRCQTIPIHPAQRVLPLIAPQLCGNPLKVQQVIGALQLELGKQTGLRAPPEAWLRELSLVGDEAQLSLAPGLPGCSSSSRAQAAFETLRGLLPDTDIYVRTAAQ